ncbi:A-kinase anchor protein 13 [Platysternon megacephalum]|uniref:A-kinase anchor protein 13 n=1 Tax=Platysternon megacephalum TaxID=55544 RepID=A0A4D9EPA3_9SAUR|nr:A-kinase anchor protein 13 [Platysternon megacephalum]
MPAAHTRALACQPELVQQAVVPTPVPAAAASSQATSGLGAPFCPVRAPGRGCGKPRPRPQPPTVAGFALGSHSPLQARVVTPPRGRILPSLGASASAVTGARERPLSPELTTSDPPGSAAHRPAALPMSL